MNDRIEKTIELKAGVSRVWQALTDYKQFGEWFQVKLEGPFVVGQRGQAQLTYPGYKHCQFEVHVQKMEPEHFFSFHWHPYAIEAHVDYSHETPTLVEFHLEKIKDGTRLSVIESGFDKIPAERRLQAYRMNNEGWSEQMKNIESYVSR